jgi:glycosyltransferase involved in cell wall biosynthesis
VAWLGHAGGERADGLSTYSQQVVSGLRRHEAEVFFHHAARDGNLVPVDPDHALAWPTLRFKTVTVPTPGFRRRMGRWLEANRPDVAHCSLSFTLADGWVGAEAERFGGARVVTLHLPFGEGRGGRALVMREIHRFWASRLRHYQRVIVFTEDHRLRLAEVGVELERIEVVPNAVDTDLFSPGESARSQPRFQGADLVVGFAGRLDPEKGVRELLAGFQLAGLGPGARLVLAGSGALEGQVRRAVERDRRVVYLGQLSQIQARVDFWRGLDVFCLPSSAEGLSLSLLEAMASGCAVMVTPAGGLEASRAAGLELDPSQLTRSVAQQLRRLAGDPELVRERGRIARAEAVQHHGIEPMLLRLLSIYSECIGEQHQAWGTGPR